MTVTRGWGLLERFLSERRSRLAESLMDDDLRRGRILDIGCGKFPLFLIQTSFGERYALEKFPTEAPAGSGVMAVVHDVESGGNLPFCDDAFAVVTMLAVLEHLDPGAVPTIIDEVYRVLQPGGLFIFTTPPPRTDRLLHMMAKVKLVSAEEIDEHKKCYTSSALEALLRDSDFRGSYRMGSFEMFMNNWAVGRKAAT